MPRTSTFIAARRFSRAWISSSTRRFLFSGKRVLMKVSAATGLTVVSHAASWMMFGNLARKSTERSVTSVPLRLIFRSFRSGESLATSWSSVSVSWRRSSSRLANPATTGNAASEILVLPASSRTIFALISSRLAMSSSGFLASEAMKTFNAGESIEDRRMARFGTLASGAPALTISSHASIGTSGAATWKPRFFSKSARAAGGGRSSTRGSRSFAPRSIHHERSSISASVSWGLPTGGMCSLLSSGRLARSSIKLAAASPGFNDGPCFPPARRSGRVSMRRLPLLFEGLWHSTHLDSMIGWMAAT